jgi:alkanesulfonate monooxygenase SsuD/methylene tetrahydromethanopterin reductase-like flavin-dependent oxidoreductase (luciferase family)
MITVSLQYDMRAPDHGIAPELLYAAAVDQSEWADKLGLTQILLSEHHATDDGYLPSPLVLGGAVAARTKQIEIGFYVLLLPFYDWVRLAEDLAVLDLISKGRVRPVFGAGYRPEEFEQFGVDMTQRLRLIEEGVEVLKKAWTGEPFDYRGRKARVLPRPYQKPHPRITLGGTSPASARRAARIADNYVPTSKALYDLFREEQKKLGKPAPLERPFPPESFVFIHVSENVEQDWQRIAPYVLHDMNEYGRWTRVMRDTTFKENASLAELRASGPYRVFTPAECISFAKQIGHLALRPLCGGMDPELAWESLQLIEKKVLPQL